MDKVITEFIKAKRQYRRSYRRYKRYRRIIKKKPKKYQKAIQMMKTHHDKVSRAIKAGQAKSYARVGRPSKWLFNAHLMVTAYEALDAGKSKQKELHLPKDTPVYKYINISKFARKHHEPPELVRYLAKRCYKELRAKHKI